MVDFSQNIRVGAVGKATGSKNRSVSWWQEQINMGLNFQEVQGCSREWKWYRQWHRHHFKKGTLPYNLLFAHAQQTADQVLTRLPHIMITPAQPGFEVQARIVEKLDNALLRTLGVKRQLRRMLTDSFLCGNGYGFDGYDSSFGFDPAQLDPAKEEQTLTMFDRRGNFIEYNRNVNPGTPWFLRARPDDVIWPWGTTESTNAPWVAQRIFRPLRDLKRDVKYQNTKDLQGTHAIRRSTSAGQGEETLTPEGADPDSMTEWVELFQVHDLETGKLFALTMQESTKLLRDVKDFTQMGSLPVHTLTPNEDTEWVFGIPDARVIEPQQREINDVKLQLMKHRRAAIVKFLYRGDSLKEAEVEKMLDEDVRAAVRVNADVDVAMDNIVKHIKSDIPADLSVYAEQIKIDAREILRLGPNQLGAFLGKTHISSAETKEVKSGSLTGTDSRQEILNDVIIRIVRRFNMYIFRHWTTQRLQEVIGPAGASVWVKFTGPEVAHDYIYTARAAPPVVQGVDGRRRDAVELMRAWREANPPNPQDPTTFRLPEEIQRFVFSQFEEINTDKLLAQIGFPAPGQIPRAPGSPQTIGDLITLEQQAASQASAGAGTGAPRRGAAGA